MKRILTTAALLLLVLTLGTVSVSIAQQQGGAFLPTFNYVISGQWTFTQATPLVFEGATNNAFETFIAVTDPTADRTITLPNASGTVLLGGAATSAGLRAGSANTSGNNPVSVTTGLSVILGCSATARKTAPLSNADGFIITVETTAVAGQLDIYRWTTLGAAASDNGAVEWICVGTS